MCLTLSVYYANKIGHDEKSIGNKYIIRTLIQVKQKKVIIRRPIKLDVYLTSIVPFSYTSIEAIPKSGVYDLENFMEILEHNFAKENNEYNIMIHRKNGLCYIEAKYLNFGLLTNLYVKIDTEEKNFFYEEFKQAVNIQYCEIKKKGYFITGKKSPVNTI